MAQSPYYRTRIIDDYLDILDMPTLPTSENDEYYTIESKFNYRPDLLSHCLLYTSPSPRDADVCGMRSSA